MRRLMPMLLGIMLGVYTMLPVYAQAARGTAAPPPRNQPAMTPAMRAQMMANMQSVMVMMHNTAVTTPQYLYVLQGDHLLQYNLDLTPRNQAILPLTATTPAPVTPPAAGATTTPPPMPPLQSMVPAKLLPVDGGIIVVLNQQLLRYDTNLALVNQATLPTQPVLTVAELDALCPVCQMMQMMMMSMMRAGGPGMMGMMGAAAPAQ